MIEVRQTDEFAKWLRTLRDLRAADRIIQRIRRLERGNAGDVKSVSGPVMEMRIDHGPGYRVYFIRRGDTVMILLCGGDKRSQPADIRRARKMADDWKD
jgi:putative addiction module killer protein